MKKHKNAKWFLLFFAVGCLMFPGISSAVVLDLTTAGSTGWINDTWFTTTQQQPTGTGYIDPFLRIEAKGTEKGYNTDGTLQFDTKPSIWTHSIRVSDLYKINIGGTYYYEFLLDINEANGGGNEYLSLDTIQIYLGNTNNLTGYPFTGTASKVYDLDTGGAGDSVVEMNYALNHGSGSGDMLVYIPTSHFGSDLTKYVYFYSEFGNFKEVVQVVVRGQGKNDIGSSAGVEDFSSSAGFEEWAARINTGTSVPEPGTMMLLGSGLAGLAGWGRKKFRK